MVVCLGFGALAAFWVLGTWPTHRGLFHYRSATVGDGLLLPVIVGLLVLTLRDHRLSAAEHEARWTAGSALVGLLVGAGTQAAWLADDSPVRNWTIPKPHEFNAPGWWHAAFFTSVSVALFVLATGAARRIRSAQIGGNGRAVELAGSPWLAVLFAAGLTFAGLVAVDNADASSTNAGTATTASLIAASAVAFVVLGLAFGRLLGRALLNLALGAVAAASAVVISAIGLPGPPGVVVAVLVSALVIGVALSEPFREDGPRWGRAIPAILVLLAGASGSLKLATAHGLTAALVLVAAAAIAVAIGGVRTDRASDLARAWAATAYVFGVLTLAAWLRGRHPDKTEAGWTVGTSLFFLDILVFALVQRRFKGFMADVQRDRRDDELRERTGSRDRDPKREPADAKRAWSLIVALTLPALVALAVLLAIAGPVLGTNKVAGGSPPHLLPLLILASAAITLGAIALILGRRVPRPTQELEIDAELNLPVRHIAPVLFACSAWTVALIWALKPPLHYPVVAGVAGAIFFALSFEDIVNSPVRLQLAKPALATWLAATAVGVSSAAGIFWLVSTGLWDGSRPASVGGALEAGGIVLLTQALLAAVAGVANAKGLRTPHITEQAPSFNVSVQPLMYSAVALIAVALPTFVVGRVEASSLKNAGIATIASIGFLPSLLAIFRFVLGNNAEHGRFEATITPPAIIRQARGDEHVAEPLDNERIKRLRFHVYYVNWLAGGALAAGMLWAALHVFH